MSPRTHNTPLAPERDLRVEPARAGASLFDPAITRRAVGSAVRKLDPRIEIHNPLMFVVEIGSVWTSVLLIRDLGHATRQTLVFEGLIVLFLWFTVLFANFAEAIAEGRGKAQADALRKTRTEMVARVRRPDGTTLETPSAHLGIGDEVVVETGELIPGDGDIVEGAALVDESAITGESAPVIRESGGDRSAVTGGTRVLSDRVVIRITTRPGETFMDRMIALIEGANRKRTPNEIALTILLAGLTLIFLLAVVTLQPFAVFSGTAQTTIVLVGLFICLAPTTIGGLLSAIGIAGMDRLVQRNVLAMSGRAVEAAGDISTLILDKTGTITYGNRMASALVAVGGADERDLAEAALLASIADETPEGRSIVEFVHDRYGIEPIDMPGAQLVPFSAYTRMSGIDWEGRSIRKGAGDAVRGWVVEQHGTAPGDLGPILDDIARSGGTPLVVAVSTGASASASPSVGSGSLARADTRILGVVHLKDTVKEGIADRFAEMRAMGIRTIMVTGDNPLTAAAIAAEAGVDDFMAEATPEEKLVRIREEQASGDLVAMTGDGTNDAPALAQADVGVAMNSGTQAAKEAGNMVDLDSNPTKLLEVVEIGKQLLITRGALTTFSIANDVAKYFAIIPAMFVGVLPGLKTLNVMRLDNAHSAILSAVIFNAIIIVLLIPLALRGVRFKAAGAQEIFRRNIALFGIGGVIAPFIGIKLIDLVVSALGVR